MRAWLNLRHIETERATAFTRGLKRLGYEVVHGTTGGPGAKDIMITWNRIQMGDIAARAFESAGHPVLVAENAAWGDKLAGDRWISLAKRFHNTTGMFPVDGPERWDKLGVELQPWRVAGETVILPQRGIGCKEVAMPRGWPYGKVGRIRLHPGKRETLPLEQDLRRAGKVITWGSGAAVKALMWGIRVESHMPNWIAEQDNTDAGRLSMFRRLAWAQVRFGEIESGEALKRLLF